MIRTYSIEIFKDRNDDKIIIMKIYDLLYIYLFYSVDKLNSFFAFSVECLAISSVETE